MSRATLSDPAVRRVERLRLLRKSTQSLNDDDRSFLLNEVDTGDLEQTLAIALAHGCLGSPTRVVEALVERLPETVPGDWWANVIPQLARALGQDAYADLVERMAIRLGLLSPSGQRLSDDEQVPMRWFVGQLRGGGRFNAIIHADYNTPFVDGAQQNVGLELLGSRYDDGGCLRKLTAFAADGPAQALHMWCVARAAGDSELEEAVRDLVLGQVNFGDSADASPLQERVLQEVWDWLAEGNANPERSRAVLTWAERAHAQGTPWGLIVMRLPDRMRHSVAQRALDDGEVVPGAHAVFEAELRTGSEAAWERFFACEPSLDPFVGVRTRDLLRNGLLPASPDDHFWERFEAAWRRACVLEQMQIGLAEKRMPPAHDEASRQLRERHLRRTHRNLFPRLSEAELIDKLLSCPPTLVSTRMLLAALRVEQRRLADERVTSFAELAKGSPHEQLPDIRSVDLLDVQAVQNFLVLHGQCGPQHVREALTASEHTTVSSPIWWVRQPWFGSILDEDLENETRRRLRSLPSRELVRACESSPEWITREEVVRAVIGRPENLWVDDVPDWLDDGLLERARRTGSTAELRSLLPRFRNHARLRKPFLELIQARLLEQPASALAVLAAELLDSASAWEKYGEGIVGGLLEIGQKRLLLPLVIADAERPDPPTENGKTKRSVAIHLVLARALLRQSERALERGDHEGVERALIAIALLDPPPPFTRNLRRFSRLEGLNETSKHWLERIHGIVKSGGGSEATIQGAWDCIIDYVGGGES